MNADINKLSYLSDPVDPDTIKRIASGIGNTWDLCLDGDQQILDCKITSARWVTNQSAIDLLGADPELVTDYKVIEARYAVWMTTDEVSAWEPEHINRVTNTFYTYINEEEDLTDPNGIVCIQEIEHENIEGNIVRTELSEEGILELLDSLEGGKLSGDFPDIEPEDLPDDLHPRIRELHNRLHAIALQEQYEFEMREAEIDRERNRLTLEFAGNNSHCSHYSHIVFLSTIASKLGTYYFEIKLSYKEGDNSCYQLEITAYPRIKGAMAKLSPVWMRYFYIPPVKIQDASKYLTDWVADSDNLELLRTLHFQSRSGNEKM
jgi:hypothetical protein